MRLDDRARLLCAGITAAVCVAVSVAVPTSAGSPALVEPSRSTAARCPLADATPEQASARGLAGALRCLVNRQRSRRGLARVHDAPVLDRIARRFAIDMRRRGYFSHVTPDGRGLRDRVRSAGLRASGEVLAWGCGELATPAAAVRAWVASQAHRRLVLSPRYTIIGAGVANGAPAPVCRPAASTSVVQLGRPR